MSRENNVSMLPLLSAVIGGILIGCSPIFVRVSDLGPMSTGFYRMMLAMPLLYLWMQAEDKKNGKPEKLSSKDVWTIIFAGVFFGVDIAIWNWSVDYTAIVNATLFNNTAAFFVPILAWLLYKQKPRATFVIAMITGLAGSAMLAGDSFTISLKNVVGDLASLISGLTVAIYVVIVKNLRERINTGRLMLYTATVSGATLLLCALLFGETMWPLSKFDLLSIFALAILVHVGGQGLLAYSMGRVPASYVALIMLLAPATASVLGWLVYSESLNLLKFTGVALIMASIIAVREKDHIIDHPNAAKT